MVIDKIKAKKAKIKVKAKARKAKKTTKIAQKTEANFDMTLPDDFENSR